MAPSDLITPLIVAQSAASVHGWLGGSAHTPPCRHGVDAHMEDAETRCATTVASAPTSTAWYQAGQVLLTLARLLLRLFAVYMLCWVVFVIASILKINK